MRKLISGCLALMLTVGLCITAAAAEDGKFLHSYYGILEQEDAQYLAALGACLPSGGTAEITLASQKNLPSLICTAEDLQLPTTFYCVVDTSTAIPKTARKKSIDILNALNAAMGEQDSMILLTVGTNLEESELLTTAEQRQAAISAIEENGSTTNLYYAVSMALDNLGTKTAYSANKCLVVISDGVNDGKSSVTEGTVLSKIEESTIPVFGIGMLQDYPSDYSRAQTGTVERMAEASVGGAFYETSKSGTSPGAIAEEVWYSMQNATVVMVDTAKLDRTSLGDTMLLTVSYTTADAQYEDSISVLTKDLPEPAGTAGSTVQSKSSSQTKEERKVSENFPVILVLLSILAVAAVAAAIVLTTAKKKQIHKDPDDPKTSSPEGNSTTVPVLEAEKSRNITRPIPSVQVCFTTIGHGDQVFRFTIPKDRPVTLGRTSQSEVVVAINGNTDMQLSAIQCTLRWVNGKLSVTDKNSTNGTLVNGAWVMPGTQQLLEQGDRLKIGSREFRVSFSEEGKTEDAYHTMPLY